MERNLKVKNLEELAGLLSSLRAEGKKVVHCHGVLTCCTSDTFATLSRLRS